MSAPIYLDYQATTPLAPEVATAMLPWIEDKFGNPHSPHRIGREAAAAVELARERVLDVLNSTSVRVERSRDTPSSRAETRCLGFAREGPSTSLGANG